MNDRSNILKPSFISVPYQNNCQHGKQEMKQHEDVFHAAPGIISHRLSYICDRTTSDVRRLLLSSVTHQSIYLKRRDKENMKINSRITGLLILTILTFALINTNTHQTYVAAKEQVTAEKYIEITEQIKTRAENLKESVNDSRINITSANILIIEGETLLNEAKVLLQKADYTLAFQKAKEAQEKFRHAIQILTASDEQPNEERKKGISTAINRTADRIQRIKDAVDGINITSENQNYLNSVKQNLEKAESNLADAKSALEKEPVNISTAANLHAEANKNVEEAFKSLKQIGDWTLTWRSEKFHKGIINQLEKIKDQLDEAEKKGSKINDLRTQLIEAEELIQEAMTKLTTSDKKEGLNQIKVAKEMLEDIVKELAKRQRR